VDADNAQTDFIRAFFNNGGVPSGIYKVLNRTLTQEQADEIRAKWNAARSRNYGNQQTTAVLDQNGDYQRIGANLDELQGDSLREFTETRVAMAFGVPPFIIYSFAGIQHNTYSNSEEAWRQFWASTMTPWFKKWRTFLSRRLLSEFVSRDLILGERIRLNWDMSQVAALIEDVDKLRDRARKDFVAGGLTLNEFRAIAGEQEDPAGNYYLRAFNLIPVEMGSAAEPPAEDPADDLVPAKRGLTILQRKALVKAKAGREVISRRIERDIFKLLQRDYEAVASRVEAA
jgi:HK97 family phage portal protein